MVSARRHFSINQLIYGYIILPPLPLRSVTCLTNAQAAYQAPRYLGSLFEVGLSGKHGANGARVPEPFRTMRMWPHHDSLGLL